MGKGEVPPTENDGIVTAEEVGGLKLGGTWLVVLSACDTGGGEAKAGEGVMGLRRGFVQAGGQNLLMTLWPISDEITVQIMLDFYDAAFKPATHRKRSPIRSAIGSLDCARSAASLPPCNSPARSSCRHKENRSGGRIKGLRIRSPSATAKTRHLRGFAGCRLRRGRHRSGRCVRGEWRCRGLTAAS